MRRALLLAVATCLFLRLAATGQGVALEKGKVLPRIVCTGSPGQTYALYIPTRYSPDKEWPIIYAFDPAARGPVAIEAIRAAAERFGYIVATSNNSHNGPMGGSSDAANAVFHDTHARLSVDDRRIYTAGFSGGARLATQIALLCKTCIAGVIANGAGFPANMPPAKDLRPAYFLAMGNADFNFVEMLELRHELDQVHSIYRIELFDGAHEWAPAPVWNDALRWMDLQAIRSGSLTKDSKLVQQMFQEELEEARAAETKGDKLSAARNYEYLIRDFNGLADVASLKPHLDELKASKEFKAAEKQERSDAERQARLSDKASAQMQGIATNDTDLATYGEIRLTIAELKKQVTSSPNPTDPNTLILRRALGQLVVQAYESGERSVERKDYRAALAYFDLVAAGARSAGGARYERARVYAVQGDAKKCLAELKQAEAAGFHDPEALDAAEFKPYRQLPEFQSIAEDWKKQTQP